MTQESSRKIETSNQSGGINISGGNIISVEGDFVGRDQIVKISAPVAIHQLPPDSTNFIGREEEVSKALAILSTNMEAPTILIFNGNGMGGVGKTALAIHIAHQLIARYPDSQLFVNLRGGSGSPMSSSAAMAHVIRSFHPDVRLPNTVEDLTAIYRSVLYGQRILLILDDAADAEQVTPLLPSSSSCAVFITSRKRFDLPGVPRVDLDVLSADASRELLMRLDPRLRDTPDIAARIASLCGHLPLVLRIAGSTLRARPHLIPAEYAGELAAISLSSLSQGSAHITIQEVFDLSYGQLSPQLQAAWVKLAVFTSTFDRTAAAAVWNVDERQTKTWLDELANSSLINRYNETQRYALHPLLLDFALSFSPQFDLTEAHERHAHYYLSVARQAGKLYFESGEGVLRGLALYDQEWPNIQSALTRLAKQAPDNSVAARLYCDYIDASIYYLELRLSPKELIMWLERAVAAARLLGDRQAESSHLSNLGLNYSTLGESRQAIEYYQQALTIAREIGDKHAESVDLVNLGQAYATLGEIRHGIEFYTEALQIAREIGDRLTESTVLDGLGGAYSALGDYRRAIESHEQALLIARAIGNRRGEGNILGNLGVAYAALGNLRHAIEFYEQALIIAREIGDRRSESNQLGSLGNAYAVLGEAHHAIEYYEQALHIARELGDQVNQGVNLANLGIAYTRLGDIQRAFELSEQSLLIAQRTGDRRSESSRLGNLGMAYASLGEIPNAIQYYEKALVIAQQLEDARSLANVSFELGVLYAEHDRWHDGLRLLEQSLAIRRQFDDLNARADTIFQIARTHHLMSNLENARVHYRDALRLYQRTHNQRGIAACKNGLGRLAIQLGFSADATRELAQAHEMYVELGDTQRASEVEEVLRLANHAKEKQPA